MGLTEKSCSRPGQAHPILLDATKGVWSPKMSGLDRGNNWLSLAACPLFLSKSLKKHNFVFHHGQTMPIFEPPGKKFACQTLKVGPVMYDKNLRPIKACLPHAVEPLSLSFQRKRSNTQAIHLTCWRFRNPEICHSPRLVFWCFSIDPSSKRMT